MSAIETVQLELAKASSMVTTARRLLNTGTVVDLSALEGKVRFICETIAGIEREQGRDLVGGMESLIADLDRLAAAIHDRYDLPPEEPDGSAPADPAGAV